MGAGHDQFNYKFSNTEGINFGALPDIPLTGDLLIYFDSLENPQFIDCWCTRWDQNNWNIVVETFLDENDIQTLINNTMVGAVGELYEVLGSKVHYDMTWEGDNTLKLVPTLHKTYTTTTDTFSGSGNSNLINMRNDTLVYVKNITTSPREGVDGWVNVKIEAVKSGGSI